MKNINPLLLTDFYKVHHHNMYPKDTTKIYSNFTARKSRMDGVDSVVVFGIQHVIKEYLIDGFNTHFFSCDLEDILKQYSFAVDVNADHIKALHKLGYLPIEIKALEEGTCCPIGVPLFTIQNTLPEFFWLTNYLETLLSCSLWQSITSATVANEYRKLLNHYSVITTGNADGVQWQAHDFSMRGMSSVESAIISGMAHLTSFTGTDSIPSIYALAEYYKADGLIGASVPATEHSVMCMGTKDDEIGTFKELLDKYNSGFLSVVSDTWDLWFVLLFILPKLKDEILARDGKLVIRPDSGDPVDIICGLKGKDFHSIIERDGKPRLKNNDTGITKEITAAEYKGVIELLWDTFGGSINDQGYKVLDPHIGAIYGDSITLDRAKQICERLMAKGFASTNIVFGVGSYTYQYNTRDTFGFAMKATYGEVNGVGREIFKDPITDNGTKKSAKGLLAVYKNDTNGGYFLQDQATPEMEQSGELKTVFKNGKLIKEISLEQIRENIRKSK